MKLFNRLLQFSFVFSLMFVFQSMTIIGSVEGTWTYSASNTPEEYAKGEISISQKDGDYAVVVSTAGYDFNAKKVTVAGNEVVFSFYIEDAKIDVTLNIDGDSMTGEAETYDGTVGLSGKRK